MLTWDTLCRFLSVFPGTSTTRLLVIAYLAGHERASVSTLAERAGVSGASMHGVIGRMIDEGVVSKEVNDENGRERVCRLTVAGRQQAVRLGRRVRVKLGQVDSPEESLLA